MIEKILKGSLNLILSPLSSVKIQIMDRKVMGLNPGYLLKSFLLYWQITNIQIGDMYQPNIIEPLVYKTQCRNQKIGLK